MSEATPTIAQKAPYPVDVEEGRTYYWCTCGNSKKQPLCDGSHKGGAFTPMAWTAPATARVWFCGCKHTAKAPLCDGKHKAL
jgi:CDGSH-type Zn-finger protein